MKVNYIKVVNKSAQETITKLKNSGEILSGFKIREERGYVLIPVRNSKLTGDFEMIERRRMRHVGSFERISDFFIIKERDGWEKILSEIVDKQSPRAVFIDRGVKGKYRLRNIERVYGDGNPEGIHKENGLRYYIDLRRAYFSPRLAGLRSHISGISNKLDKKNLVVDMYAGIGPITIPLLKKGIRTVAIDVNDDAIRLLRYNMMMNSVKGDVVIADSNEIYSCFKMATHVIMNNPSQPLSVSGSIIRSFNIGTEIHFLHLLNSNDQMNIEGVTILEKRVVHGYSPSSSLQYFRLKKI